MDRPAATSREQSVTPPAGIGIMARSTVPTSVPNDGATPIVREKIPYKHRDKVMPAI